MDIKAKIRSAWNHLTGKKSKSSNSELGADEVIKKEVFPNSANKKSGSKKPASKRTRPTNSNYRMIDPSDDTSDAGKS
ncbi:MAG: hypothetical protein J1F69_06145 [Clostridiales bacterium]|nr:hypothetical protein [Clostridiales bacterium]